MPNTAGIFGTINDASTQAPQTNPNSFQYGGAAGGAADREGQLSGLGAAGANYGATNAYQGAQNSALAQMQAQAAGNDGGVAEGQLQQGAALAAQQQQSAAAAPITNALASENSMENSLKKFYSLKKQMKGS